MLTTLTVRIDTVYVIKKKHNVDIQNQIASHGHRMAAKRSMSCVGTQLSAVPGAQRDSHVISDC